MNPGVHLGLTLLLSTFDYTQSKCSPSWKEFQGSCFKISEDEKSWHNAADDCRIWQDNATLAVIPDADTNQFLKREFQFIAYAVWVGGRRDWAGVTARSGTTQTGLTASPTVREMGRKMRIAL